MNATAELAIGQVAEASGVSVSVVRYYDEFGLITPVRRVGGKRRFGPDAVSRVTFVRRAQAVGFSLADIKTLLDDQRGRWPELVDQHLLDLRQRRDDLNMMISTLEQLRRCACEEVARCEHMVSADEPIAHPSKQALGSLTRQDRP